MVNVKACSMWLGRVILLLGAVVSIVVLSALFAARLVSRQMAAAVQMGVERAAEGQDLPTEQTVAIDFHQAAGIDPRELAAFLDEQAKQSGVHGYLALVTLEDRDGNYLADGRVIVQYNAGKERLLVGKSGVLRFLLDQKKLPGLTLIVPKDYATLKQRSIPLGTAHEPEEQLDTDALPFNVVWDGHVESALARQLLEIKAAGNALGGDAFREQIARRRYPMQLPKPPSDERTPAEIYQQCKDSVVIVAHMSANGHVIHAGGVVLRSDGVIATAYHVIDKPNAVARGVMTTEGTMAPITEILAADQSADVALIKIAADGLELTPSPLSTGDPEGSAVTVISHPGSQFHSLTQGTISRYYAITRYGRVSIAMTVTAEFADGSSGGPIFNAAGAITGLVSATEPLGNQMVLRLAVPVESIWSLIAAESGPR